MTTEEEQNQSDTQSDILRQVGAYYTDKINTHGTTPAGVDWNGIDSQEMRYRQMLRIAEPQVFDDTPFSLIDYGCGYGGLAQFMRTQQIRGKLPPFRYTGFDIVPAMIEHATALYAAPNIDSQTIWFTSDPTTLQRADYVVASGIFSVKLGTESSLWQTYCLDMLDSLAALALKGFAFNMLTGFADPDRMRPNLYYPDPHWIFDHCRTRYSKWVALLHDYGLYEFTIHVRL